MSPSLGIIMLAAAMLAPQVVANAAPDGSEAVRAGPGFAQCVYAERKADVVGALNASTAELAKHYRNALRAASSCGSSPNASDDILRGMFAEAALRDVPAAAGLGPLAPEPDYRRGWFAATGRDASVDEMAVCMAARHPIGIRRMLGTSPESAEELAIVTALNGVIAPCLPQGAAVKAAGQAFRAALAEAFYHRAASPVLAEK